MVVIPLDQDQVGGVEVDGVGVVGAKVADRHPLMFDILCQVVSVISTHLINTSDQHILTAHLVHTRCQNTYEHTLSTKYINTPCRHTLTTHFTTCPLNKHSTLAILYPFTYNKCYLTTLTIINDLLLSQHTFQIRKSSAISSFLRRSRCWILSTHFSTRRTNTLSTVRIPVCYSTPYPEYI